MMFLKVSKSALNNSINHNAIGLVKNETITDDELFESLKQDFHSSTLILLGTRKSQSGSVYEYLTDCIRDNYDVTLEQCSRVSKQLADFYGIKKFYYGD